MGRNENSAVLLRRRQPKHMVVLVNRAAHGAKGVVATSEDVGHGKRRHAGSAGSLDNADIGDVMGSQGVELDLQGVGIAALVMRLQNAIGDSSLFRLRFVRNLSGKLADFLRVALRDNLRAAH